MFALHSDPAVWGHFPSGRHPDRGTTDAFIAGIEQAWTDDGLGYWAVRELSVDGNRWDFVGAGGCQRRFGLVWNTYYRLAPSAWGRGLAGEIAAAGRAAALQVDPELPVVAYLVAHNTASRRTAERAGLTLAWSGPDQGNPDPSVVRLLYSDRPLTAEVVNFLAANS